MKALGDAGDVKAIAEIVAAQPGIPWEAIPDIAMNSTDVWQALLASGVPQTALMRQLPRLTNLGLASGDTGRQIAQQLRDESRIVGARIHPMQVLVALRTYASGHGARGNQTWQPEARIIDALDAAFYTAYKAVEPTGKRLLLALDVSGSMTWCGCGGLPVTPREVTAAMSLVTANVEDGYEIIGFETNIQPLAISPRQRLDDVLRYMLNRPAAGTDCSLPMLWALQQHQVFDAFVIYTDNETWAGRIHPFQALKEYRDKMGIAAKLVVVGTTSTGFSIADPDDAGMMDVCGFDTTVPNVISDFIRQSI